MEDASLCLANYKNCPRKRALVFDLHGVTHLRDAAQAVHCIEKSLFDILLLAGSFLDKLNESE